MWWLRFLSEAPMKTISSIPADRKVMTIHTDAAGDRRLAWVASCGPCLECSTVILPTSLRKWVCYRKTQIATWDLVAARCALWHFLKTSMLQFLDSLQINLFVDSTVALGTLMRGCSRQKDWNGLVTDLWFQVARSGTLLLAWRVPSSQNIADIPTRPSARAHDLKTMWEAGFREVEWHWPQVAPWL